MALPSSSKPIWTWVNEIDDFGPTQLNQNWGCNLEKAFFEVMAEWHKSLSPQRKKSLMKREIIDKAKCICRSFRMSYAGLPRTWLRTLHDVHYVAFKHIPKTEKYKKKAHKFLRRAVVMDKLTSTEMKTKQAEIRKGTIDPQCLISELKELIRTSKAVTTDDDAPKMEDLTGDPPPTWWMEAYCQNQNVKRTLHTALSKDKKTLVVYYHYSKGEEGNRYHIELFPNRYETPRFPGMGRPYNRKQKLAVRKVWRLPDGENKD